MIAIIGAGPAGLSAAATAASHGQKVLLFDSSPSLGGQYWRHLPSAWNDDQSLHYNFDIAQRLFDEVLGNPLITRYSKAHIWYAEKIDKQFKLYAVISGKEEIFYADKVILATGAYDRSIPFEGWTLPGVMTPGAAQAMLKSHGTLVGEKILLAGTGPFLLSVASNLSDAGASIVGIYEFNRRWRWLFNFHGLLLNPGKIKEAIYYLTKLRRAGVKIRYGKFNLQAERGFATINGVRIDCNVVAAGWGFTPDVSLASILGTTLKVDRDANTVVQVNSRQETSIHNLYAAGESTGIGGSSAAIAEGIVAGGGSARFNRWRTRVFARGLQMVYPVPTSWTKKISDHTIICRCEEVNVADIRHALCELGADSARSAKLLTRTGMGLCQGRICSRNALELIAAQMGKKVQDSERIATSGRPMAGTISLGELGDGLEKGF